MSFPKLKKYIENSALRRETIILMILLLSDEEIRGKSSWNKLARRFFKEYNESIHTVCGYNTGIDGIGSIVVERDFSELFLYTVGGCMRTGILTDCSFDKMAEYIDLIFDTGYTKNTILNKLKEQNPDYLWIENLLVADKKRIISEKKRRTNRKCLIARVYGLSMIKCGEFFSAIISFLFLRHCRYLCF